jgi:hypothetical protein
LQSVPVIETLIGPLYAIRYIRKLYDIFYFDIFSTRCNITQLIYFWKTALHVSDGYLHPSSGAHTTVFTLSGTCQTVTAACRYCGRIGSRLSVVWELY